MRFINGWNGYDRFGEMNGLDLFSGIGGLSLALAPWVRPVAYCESDLFAQLVLLSRMGTNILPIAPIWDDVRTLRAECIPSVDIIYGGFPCQDLSVAGNGAGLDGKRSGLISEVYRLVRSCQPRFVFLENVPAIVVRGLDRVLLEFNSMGYDARWTIVSAAEMGAVHIRERWFLLAHANGVRLWEECGPEVRWNYSKRKRSPQSNGEGEARRTSWPPNRRAQPRVDRTGDGIPHRLDRHRGLGNAVHPKATKEAFMCLMGLSPAPTSGER